MFFEQGRNMYCQQYMLSTWIFFKHRGPDFAMISVQIDDCVESQWLI